MHGAVLPLRFFLSNKDLRLSAAGAALPAPLVWPGQAQSNAIEHHQTPSNAIKAPSKRHQAPSSAIKAPSKRQPPSKHTVALPTRAQTPASTQRSSARPSRTQHPKLGYLSGVCPLADRTSGSRASQIGPRDLGPRDLGALGIWGLGIWGLGIWGSRDLGLSGSGASGPCP